jgi:hypothetical protein
LLDVLAGALAADSGAHTRGLPDSARRSLRSEDGADPPEPGNSANRASAGAADAPEGPTAKSAADDHSGPGAPDRGPGRGAASPEKARRPNPAGPKSSARGHSASTRQPGPADKSRPTDKSQPADHSASTRKSGSADKSGPADHTASTRKSGPTDTSNQTDRSGSTDTSDQADRSDPTGRTGGRVDPVAAAAANAAEGQATVRSRQDFPRFDGPEPFTRRSSVLSGANRQPGRSVDLMAVAPLLVRWLWPVAAGIALAVVMVAMGSALRFRGLPPLGELPALAGFGADVPEASALATPITVPMVGSAAGGPTATPRPSATASPAPTQPPTYTPYPTYTPPATYTPPPTPPRDAAPVVAPANVAPEMQIELSQPSNGAVIRDCVRFGWRTSAATGPGERFQLLVCQGAGCEPRFGISGDAPPVVWGPWDTRGNADLKGTPGVYRWAVALESTAGTTAKSAAGSFNWVGGTCGNPPAGGSNDGEASPHETAPAPLP